MFVYLTILRVCFIFGIVILSLISNIFFLTRLKTVTHISIFEYVLLFFLIVLIRFVRGKTTLCHLPYLRID